MRFYEILLAGSTHFHQVASVSMKFQQKLCENGSPIVFHLNPGHAGLIENKKANLEARPKAEKGGK